MKEKKGKNVEREKVKQKGTEQKQKMKVFLYDFCGFKAKREMIKNNFKNNANITDFFPHKCFQTKRSETETKVFPTFLPRKQQHF